MTANQQRAYLKRVAKEEEESIFKGREVYATKHKEPSTNSKKKGCINFDKTIKNNNNVKHNDRTLRAEHIKDGEFEVNRESDEAIELKEQMIQKAKEAYEANKSKRAPKFKATDYEHSAVVLIKPTTTMQELEAVAKHFESKYGFQCYQIAIHRDEGHYPKNAKGDSTPLEINHHAHFEFITLDKNTGKNRWREVNQKVMSDFQTEISQMLGMERGVDKRITGAYHLNHYQYRHKAQAQENERLEIEQKLKQELESKQEATPKLTRDEKERVYLVVPFDEKDKAKALGAKWDNSKKQWYIPQIDYTPFAKWLKDATPLQKIDKLEIALTQQNEAYEKLQHKYNTKVATLDHIINNEKQFTQADLDSAITKATQAILENHNKEIESLQKSYKQDKQSLESKNKALEAKISDLESKQWVGITQDDLNDLRANCGTEKEFLQALNRKFQSEFREMVKILCDGDEVKANQNQSFEFVKNSILELKEFKETSKSKQEPSTFRQAQVNVKTKSKDDFER